MLDIKAYDVDENNMRYCILYILPHFARACFNKKKKKKKEKKTECILMIKVNHHNIKDTHYLRELRDSATNHSRLRHSHTRLYTLLRHTHKNTFYTRTVTSTFLNRN